MKNFKLFFVIFLLLFDFVYTQGLATIYTRQRDGNYRPALSKYEVTAQYKNGIYIFTNRGIFRKIHKQPRRGAPRPRDGQVGQLNMLYTLNDNGRYRMILGPPSRRHKGGLWLAGGRNRARYFIHNTPGRIGYVTGDGNRILRRPPRPRRRGGG